MLRSPTEAACELLSSLGDPFPVNPWEIASRLGIPIYRGPLDSVDGLIRRDAVGWYIVIADRLGDGRAAFTLAHELGHYVMHRHRRELFTMNHSKRSPFERAANRFAAALLMPGPQLVQLALDLGPDPGRLAAACGVSRHAMAIRLIELGLAEPAPREDWIPF